MDMVTDLIQLLLPMQDVLQLLCMRSKVVHVLSFFSFFVFLFFFWLEKLLFAPMNYNALVLFLHELPIVLLCPMNYHFVPKSPFHQSKPLNQTVKVTMCCSSRGQSDNAL